MDMSMSMDMSSSTTTTAMAMSSSMVMSMSPTTTLTAAAAGQTDDTPGYYNNKGLYVPTSAERTAYQAARIPWANQVIYGHYTLWFIGGLLLVFLLLNVLWKARVRYGVLSKSSLYSKLAAASRALSYPVLPRTGRLALLSMLWTFGPLGPNIVLILGLLLASGLTWINKYYYYPPYYGSAPLYLRSEWIAMATLPFVYVLGSKRNIIAVLTGVSHEKLQVLHQGAAFNFVYMSLVHTIAAVIRALRQDGMTYTLKTNNIYVSGFVALAPLLVLFIGALPPWRRFMYEAFWYVHILMAIFFLGAMFWHGYQELDSDKYMIATIVLFFSGVLWRIVAIILNNPTLHRATGTLVGDSVIKLTIPTHLIRWSPGQHVFIRFVGLRTLEAHPFSIATVPSDPAATVRNMEFIIRPRSGFTLELYNQVLAAGKGGRTWKCLVDGPYGEPDGLEAFDEVLVAVGGSGISWGLGVLQDLIRREQRPKVKFVWAIRHLDALAWFDKELKAAAAVPDVSIDIYVTDESVQESSTLPAVEDKAEADDAHDGSSSSHDETPGEKDLIMPHPNGKPHQPGRLAIHPGRPDLAAVIEDFVRNAEGSVGIGACGPGGFMSDSANAVTRVELGILRGVVQNVTEVYFKSEQYGW